MKNRMLVLVLGVFAAMGGCAVDIAEPVGGTLSALDEGLGLVECSREPPARGLICVNGFWSTGDRCSRDSECPIGSACLSPREPHCFLTRPDEGGVECPRGSVPASTPILCAPGFEHRVVTRDGCQVCAPAVDDCRAAERCRATGRRLQECVADIVGRDRAAQLLSRAEESRISPAELLNILACGGDEGRPGVRSRPTRPSREDHAEGSR